MIGSHPGSPMNRDYHGTGSPQPRPNPVDYPNPHHITGHCPTYADRIKEQVHLCLPTYARSLLEDAESSQRATPGKTTSDLCVLAKEAESPYPRHEILQNRLQTPRGLTRSQIGAIAFLKPELTPALTSAYGDFAPGPPTGLHGIVM